MINAHRYIDFKLGLLFNFSGGNKHNTGRLIPREMKQIQNRLKTAQPVKNGLTGA